MKNQFYKLLLYFGEIDPMGDQLANGDPMGEKLANHAAGMATIDLKSLPHTSKSFLAVIFECFRALEHSHQK